MLQPDEIAYCFGLTHELPGVEFKGPGGRKDNPLFGKVMRAMMGMANRRSGGIVIVGVAEHDGVLCFDGLTPEQLATWKYESIAGALNSHTSVPIEFDRLEYPHDGKTFLVLGIHEFASMPVMCTRVYHDSTYPNIPKEQRSLILRPGAFYLRTLNNAETKEVTTSEMQRILNDLATEKGIQTFVTQTRRAGLHIVPPPEDKELFARQIDGWTGPIVDDIRSRGHWNVRIRPVTFQQDRVPLRHLRPLLMHAAINYRGWELPYVTPIAVDIDNEWIGFEHEQDNGLQAWRFFQSGQFAAEIGFLDDWDDKLKWKTLNASWKPGTLLSVLDVVFCLSEVYGLASRLAMTNIYRDERFVVVETTPHRLRGRMLYDRGNHLRFAVSGYFTKADSIPNIRTLPKEDVIARPKELAIEAVQHVFERFGWDPSDQLLAAIQSEIRIY